MIVRHVHVDRSRSHQQALDATGWKQYVNQEALSTAPKGTEEDVDMYFFELNYDPTPDQLDHEMDTRNLKADVDALSAVNEADKAFADDCPNVTQWRDDNGKACCAVFGCWVYGHGVYVGPILRWNRDRSFAGVRK